MIEKKYYSGNQEEYENMFQNNHKKNQSQATTWLQMLQKREIEKNNYRATGDLRKAKEFVNMLLRYPSLDYTRNLSR